MAGRPAELEQEWSVHAQLTFSHGGTQLEASTPQARSPAPHPCYNFQRGNIVFTTKPPGDNSRRTPQPYGRRCMSTYNIKLDPPIHPPRCHHTVTLSCAPNQLCETCDVCAGGSHSPSSARRAHTFTSHFCTRVPDKSVGTKSVASQTSQLFPPPAPVLEVPDTLQEQQAAGVKSPKRLSRSPARLKGKSPLLNNTASDAKKKQPRTVHIDVYCTGSEASCSSDAEDPSESSRQTVFESENVKVVHTREDDRLPQALCRQRRQTLSEASSSHSCFEATEVPGDSTISSLYPSQRSSFASGVTVQDSFQTDSSLLSQVTSSCAIFSDEMITSCKDTSDVDSIRQSDLSLARTESFEYENLSDRLRIQQKERAWGNPSRGWRSPDKERKYNMQQRRYQQYIERRASPFPQWQMENESIIDDESEEEDSSSDISANSAGSEMAWSFGNVNEKFRAVKREDTVRRASRDVENKTEAELRKQANKMLESGSLSDSAAPSPIQPKFLKRNTIGPFGVKDTSPPKAKLESTATSPFTAIPGKRSDQLSKAEKFGTIIGSLRKPGHHVGPSKNPDCTCYNCQQFYEELGYRNRTHSLGDIPSSTQRDKWKATLDTLMQNKLNEDSGSGEWDMGTPV